ncbi:MAG: uracil-DNA glycosylase [Actinomycetota bacterium]|nr:uracil-DNA glycosylase [Actinomycetota bacterium]
MNRSSNGGDELLDGVTKVERMDQIVREIGLCRKCSLCESRRNTVPGVGDYAAKLVIVGEGPGAQEDEQGKPFVGRSGRLLDQIIASHGVLKRSDIFITNVVKCRPPGNRTPLPTEIEACKSYLIGQLNTLRPRVILCMGSTATQTLSGQLGALTRLRGRNLSGMSPAIVATFHPSYGLRMGDPVVKLMETDYAFACSLALGA